MVIWGGYGPGFEPKADGAIYNPATDHWQLTSVSPLKPRFGLSAVWTGSNLIVWGGMTKSGKGFVTLGDGASYDPSTNRWELLPPAPLIPRTGHTAVWTGNSMMIWGGQARFDSGVLADGAEYIPSQRRWRRLPDSPLLPRASHSAVWTGAEVVIWGGLRSSNEYASDGARYDPIDRSWKRLAESSLSGRAGHIGLWTGHEVFIWGGRGSNPKVTDAADGALYDPARDSWSSLPPIRTFVDGTRFPSGVVGGAYVLVFAEGATGKTPGLDAAVAAYHLESKTWHLLDAPAGVPRVESTAVWADGRAIIWGDPTDAKAAVGFSLRF